MRLGSMSPYFLGAMSPRAARGLAVRSGKISRESQEDVSPDVVRSLSIATKMAKTERGSNAP